MNDIFDLKRFGLLFKKTIFERSAQMLGLLTLVFAATFIIYAAARYFMGFFQPAQALSFIWGFAGGGCFISAIVFGYFGTNASGSAYLTLPASSFEKWLCGVIITGVLYTILFMLFYRLIDSCFVWVYHHNLDKGSPQYRELYSAVHVLTIDNFVVKQSAMVFVNLTGAMMVGALYFNRVSAIKTALVYGAVLGVVFFINLILANLFFPDVSMAFPFHNIFIKVGNDDGSLELPQGFSSMVMITFQFIIPAILWLTALVRLREKEI